MSSQSSRQTAPLSPSLRLLVAAVPVAVVALAGSAATLPNIPTWYAGLAKPPLTPPNAVFGPVWTLLYCMIGVACWRVLGLPATAGRREALSWFFLQLALNGAWSWLFFAGQAPKLALVDIVLLLAVLAVTIRAFARVDRAAAWLLAPYAAWTAFAAYLNAGIVLLSR